MDDQAPSQSRLDSDPAPNVLTLEERAARFSK